MEEKRQAGARVATSIGTAFQHADADEVCSSILNLSSGGVFILANNPLPIDSQLSMRFHLPGDTEIIDVRGRVVWIKQRSSVFPAGMGIQFTELSPTHQRKIEAFVEAQLRSH
ncbi:MAG: PilZ domain-containing protein [Deltaproteobacteria bacterium]|nr:PilZ domain-containing protein [Deltaproteobacteria bacterium]